MGTTAEKLATRADIALQGVRMEAPVRRPDGAGPSDDGHVLVDGVNAALPRNPGSPTGYTMAGSSSGLDTGLSLQLVTPCRYLVRCVRAVLEAVPGLPIQVQREPPGDLTVLADPRAAGVTAIGIHVESLDDVRRRWMPGKGAVPMVEYEAAWDAAVRVFGRNRVSTYRLVGLGEDPDELVAATGPTGPAGSSEPVSSESSRSCSVRWTMTRCPRWWPPRVCSLSRPPRRASGWPRWKRWQPASRWS